ncbi:acyl carrier protein [Clostridium intestinale]|uniref:Acyl carrier protein n=1 Tax=Clostridium intestinale DSM 6191 TaxID=1121320 RepID=A0A1M5YVI2_9CLOT|nr:phosphopantetheine-binding protein [Clostridium intestinale]SHI16112.1 acyl carrier protein [Clostridium intestinale DSM 6191]
MIFEKIAKIIGEVINVDYEAITADTQLIAYPGIEPISIAKIVIECEKKFKITIYDEDVHKLKSISDIVEYIEDILDED